MYGLVATVEGREGLILRHLGPCTGVSWTLLSERGLALAADERGSHSYREKDRDTYVTLMAFLQQTAATHQELC